MNQQTLLRGVSVVGMGLLFSCSPSQIETFNPVGNCMPGTRACVGKVVQYCSSSGTYFPMQTCDASQICDEGLGCAACSPNAPVCVGDEIFSCSASGTVGVRTESCAFGQKCVSGACVDACEVAASDFVYVVDDNNRFLSFAPKNDRGAGTSASALFTPIGTMSCPSTRSAYPGFAGVGPFSMAVDRHASAWVLYTTGEIFKVSPQDVSCQLTAYQPTQLGWETFGMGYVSDAPGSKTDTLWVGRATVGTNTDMSMGKIDANLTLSRIGAFTGVSHSPELSGTGNAELYGYFPSNQAGQHIIARINRSDATFDLQYQLPALPSVDQNYAFAFAHWGGRFYYFINMQLQSGNRVSRVYRYDPATNSSTLIVDNSPYVIVGAGVSTCAPVQIG